ncbi:hydratase, partial [Streptococcus pneumoniae]|nr:hydratase [Streptococcus pneumoniae]
RGELFLDGESIATGSSSEVLGHPVNAIKWLAAELEAHGLKLKRGLTVSSGTFILPKPLQKGRYEAKYEGIGSVELTVH